MYTTGVFKVLGKIISFNQHDNIGSIIADNGVQYIFSSDSWTEQYPPKAGDNVDFSFDSNTGSINRLAYQTSQPLTSTPAMPTPMPPPLPNSSPNDSEQPSTLLSLQKLPQDSSSLAAQDFNNQSSSFNNQSTDSQSLDGSDLIYTQEDSYNLVDWTKKVIFNNYFNFNGRARRKEYWWSYLGFTAIIIAAMIIDGIVDSGEMFYWLAALALCLPSLGVTVRRLHDIGRSGWNLLWGIIPIIGIILLIIWLAKDTVAATNRWGAPARRL
jgi:uncharacterized membrane protein YhaH (DUF805 family)